MVSLMSPCVSRLSHFYPGYGGSPYGPAGDGKSPRKYGESFVRQHVGSLNDLTSQWVRLRVGGDPVDPVPDLQRSFVSLEIFMILIQNTLQVVLMPAWEGILLPLSMVSVMGHVFFFYWLVLSLFQKHTHAGKHLIKSTLDL